MTNIKDVALEAGVAPITVSRTINNSGPVSDATRERVERAIKELDYVPNMLGASLKSNRTNTLALLITDITNPFWTTVTRGAEDAASENGYHLFLCNTDESAEKEASYLEMLLRRRIDGIMFVPTGDNAEALEGFRRREIPIVCIDRIVQHDPFDSVRGGSRAGACLLGEHLFSLGHRRVAVLAGPQSVSTSAERVRGFLDAHSKAGLSPSDCIVQWGDFTQASGYKAAEHALEHQPSLTAIFAVNNFIALGALEYLDQVGIRVPAEVSMVTFDELPFGMLGNRSLTVANQSAYEMGYRATELLLGRLSGDVVGPARKIVLPVEIHVGNSTARTMS